MHQNQRKISWMIVAIFSTAVFAAYLCPAAISGRTMDAAATAHPCQSLIVSGADMDTAASCTRIHIAAIGQFLGALPHMPTVLLAMFLIAALLWSARLLSTSLGQALDRLRQWHRFHRLRIKCLIEQKFLQHLRFLGNGLVVLIS